MSMPLPHTALGDILVLEALFNRIYAKAVIEFGDDTVAKMIEVVKKTCALSQDALWETQGIENGGGAA